jgi:hypothetical protein
MVVLSTSDNEQFTVEKDVAERSTLIKNMMEGASPCLLAGLKAVARRSMPGSVSGAKLLATCFAALCAEAQAVAVSLHDRVRDCWT